ncbi:peroxide stress protein YaaA [Kaistella jeonii]|uniref:UPF0246 protein OA86_00695 n=1 Tax=Kaistella jeonii TaxID=266749 RepID=A0A0C1FBG3_9FLAO|nr:peroxide stress protein YaaA [Kaistella jeonii]KIA90452.1 hypothetical protein OA86_00695 [Kaistella jeonii]SFB72658.1 hypothetical protein SAMN05421876_101394 [Kaistella jeonii]VEI94984.1 Protein of uncharacterised function (DUF328) [Kaistella jeonii]
MKILSSPAKLMNIENTSAFLKTTQPYFIHEAEQIQNTLKHKSPKYLSELMEISSKLADENWSRNQNWNSKPSSKEAAPALMAFTGEVYRGLDAQSLDEKSTKYLQKNFRMLSGLYGLLKPSDRIMLYRLEMGRKFKFDGHKNLYEFWTNKVTDQLNSELKSKDVVLNLASKEYFKVIDKTKIKAPVIDFEFYNYKEGKLKTIVVYAKHARGLVIRYCAENDVKTLEEVKAFNLEKYRIDEELSTETKLVFTR